MGYISDCDFVKMTNILRDSAHRMGGRASDSLGAAPTPTVVYYHSSNIPMVLEVGCGSTRLKCNSIKRSTLNYISYAPG